MQYLVSLKLSINHSCHFSVESSETVTALIIDVAAVDDADVKRS